MTVKGFLSKLLVGVSNCEVCVYNTGTTNHGNVIELSKQQVKDYEPNNIMGMKFNSFIIIDNSVIIYAE